MYSCEAVGVFNLSRNYAIFPYLDSSGPGTCDLGMNRSAKSSWQLLVCIPCVMPIPKRALRDSIGYNYKSVSI